jgi:hydrogenase small subunit
MMMAMLNLILHNDENAVNLYITMLSDKQDLKIFKKTKQSKYYTNTYQDALKEDFILVVEGSIPAKIDQYCMVGGKPFRETVLEASKKAKAIIAVGSCATDGAGIPGACAVDAIGVRDLLKANQITTPVINLPCCPVKPTTLIGTITYYLTFKKVPQLDEQARPVAYYGKLLHDNCPRRGQFEAGNFLKDWNDTTQKDYCLLL